MLRANNTAIVNHTNKQFMMGLYRMLDKDDIMVYCTYEVSQQLQ